MASILGVSTLAYAPYMLLSFVCIAITIISSYMGWFTDKTEPLASKEAVISQSINV
ncbi:hypothetical protein [Veronia nyctiphanis]|uniref:hypothetical protein n=1 Tax=Veronia nyctiphanis TaxID=1278244 RepID=UPI002E25BEBB